MGMEDGGKEGRKEWVVGWLGLDSWVGVGFVVGDE